jgi:RecB family exonuclease
MGEMRDLILSASSLNRYLGCHLSYWFQYVAKEPAIASWKQITGLAVHAAVERVLALGESPEDALHDAFIFESVKGALDDEQGRDEALAAAQKALALYPSGDWGKPAHVERAFEVEIDGVGFSGTIDRIDEWDDGLAVRDLKTAANRPNGERYRRQLVGYAMAVPSFDERPVRVLIADVLVLTQKPYYWPIYLDPPDMDDQRLFAAELTAAAEGITRGAFEPTGLGTYACNMCSYRAICGPYQRSQKKGD